MRVALFGEHYQRSPDFHIRRSVQIAYCREFNTQDIPSEPQDFAYCVLMEDPKVQPVPILMHCDVSATLAAGKAVVGVGFGYVKASNPLDAREQGIKRTATGELSGDVLASATTFSTVNWVPGQPTHGDSGGPGFVELSDGTWRQAGVAVDNAETFVTVWPKVQWMLEDPNVDAQAIIPCHTATGQWCPTASCGDFPRSPDVAAGAWGRGAFSCESTDLGGGGQTCAGGACLRGDDDRSEPWVAAEPNEDAPDPVQVDVAGQDAASCRIDPGRERIGPLLVLVNVLAAARRRRTR